MSRKQLKRAADSKAGAGCKKKNLLLDMALAVLVLFLLVPLLTKAVTGYATFFGYKPIYILTDSMEPVIPAGSWVVGVPARGEEIIVGAVVAYRKENGTKLQPTIIHRVVGITENGFIFQGDNNELPDSQIVRADQIMYKIIYPDVSKDKRFLTCFTGISDSIRQILFTTTL